MRYALRDGQVETDIPLQTGLMDTDETELFGRSRGEAGIRGGRGSKGNGGNGDNGLDLESTSIFTLYVPLDENGASPTCQFKKLVKSTKHFFDYFTIDDTVGGVRENGSCNSDIITVLVVNVFETDLDTVEVYADFIADDLDVDGIQIVETEVMSGTFNRSCRKRKRRS